MKTQDLVFQTTITEEAHALAAMIYALNENNVPWSLSQIGCKVFLSIARY